MARHIWSILCTRASVDRETNNISIFDVIDRVTVGPVGREVEIVLALPAEFVTLWMRSDYSTPETAVGRLRLLAPDGADLGGVPFNINLDEPHVRARSIIRMSGLPLRGSGIYNFIVEVHKPEQEEWEQVSVLPLEVVLSDAS